MAQGDIDLGGNTLIVRDIKIGNAYPGQSSALRQTTAGGSTLTISKGVHAGRTILLDTASGTVITLPAAAGTGDTYRFFVSTSVTTNNHIIKVANASDTMVGILTGSTLAGSGSFIEAAGGTDDTITMNGSTTGGLVGTMIEATDIATNVWFVKGHIVGSGTMVSYLSASV